MPDADLFATDASWLPHRIDVAARTVEFIHVPRAQLANQGFLADRDPPAQQRAMVSWDAVLAMQPAAGRLHFIFHTAFCRSTLLVRALDAPGIVVGLNEPGIIASIVNSGEAAAPLIAPLLALLARPHSYGEAVVVKPTDHANMLMPALLRHRPDARAVLMTNDLPVFLNSVVRRGMMGRRWARQLFLEMQSYAGMDFGMDGRETFSMTDLQAGGLAWFLAQRWLALHAAGQIKGVAGERCRVLDGDTFNAERAKTISAVLTHLDIATPPDCAHNLANGAVFEQHSKLGGNFGSEAGGPNSPIPDEEIAQVQQWVTLIADQAGIAVPLRQTLF